MKVWAVILAGAVLAGAGASAAEEPKMLRVVVADQPSARQMTLSRRYVELMQGDQLESVIRELIVGEAAMDQTTQAMSQEDREFLIDLTTELTTDLMPQMMEQLVPVYARTFTEAELEALVAFYDSDLGRSVIAKTWTSMPETNQAMMAVMPQMMEKMQARFCAHYGCDPSELEEFSGASAAPARTK